MAFTNINDPAGVRALLEQLRTSQEWQAVFAHPPPSTDPVTTVDPPSTSNTPPSTSASVASLLSQLRSDKQPTDHTPTPPNVSQTRYPSSDPGLVPHGQLSRARPQNLQSLTFQQALPHLVHLSADPDFVNKVSEMKREQDDLERRLWQERRDIQRQQELKVTKRRHRADILSEPITKHEAANMSDTFRKELHKFDFERILPAWDALLTKQQRALQDLNVPAMFQTASTMDRERQQRVVQVLEGMDGVTSSVL